MAAISSTYGFWDRRVQTDGQTDGHDSIDSAVDPDQEYIYFWGSATLPIIKNYIKNVHLINLYLFSQELGSEDVIKRIGEFRSNLEAERCTNTIKAVIDNALDTQRNQIVELIEHVARKMSPPIRRFLTEGAEVLHKDSNSMERLMIYLEQSLETLYNTLNEVNFSRILDGIWGELSIIIYDLIQSNLDVSIYIY